MYIWTPDFICFLYEHSSAFLIGLVFSDRFRCSPFPYKNVFVKLHFAEILMFVEIYNAYSLNLWCYQMFLYKFFCSAKSSTMDNYSHDLIKLNEFDK